MKARRLTISHKESGQTMLSDAKLLTQLQAGDEASFEAFEELTHCSSTDRLRARKAEQDT